MLLFFLVLLLQTTQGQEVTIDSLGNGPGILPFNLGTTRIISHYHSFLSYVNLDKIQFQVDSISSKLSEVRPKLNDKTSFLFEPHINYLATKLSKIYSQLETFQHSRNKRGLINGLGSIIKSISGNLDQTDAIKYNSAIQTLHENEQKLEVQIEQHVSLSKTWMLQNSELLTNITKNQEQIGNVLNSIIKNKDSDFTYFAHMAQHLLILSDNIDSLFEALHKLEYTLGFIRASSTPHTVVSLAEIRNMLDKLRILYLKHEIPDLELRDYYDIIKLGYFYRDNQIVIVFKMPIAFPQLYNLYKLSVIPNKNNQILLPTLPYIAISGEDSTYMEAECPKVNSLYLCETKTRYKTPDEPNCIQHLILHQELLPSCKLTTVILKKEAVEQLDEKHYTMNFPKPTKVKIFCKQEIYKTLEGSYLAVIPYKCFIKTPHFTIANSNNHIKGFALEIIQLPISKEPPASREPPVILNSIALENLHSINKRIMLETPVELSNVTDASLYHTTIPVYAILFGAGALIIALMYRQQRLRRSQRKQSSESHNLPPSGESAETQPSRKTNPSKIIIDHSNISSSLPRRISK